MPRQASAGLIVAEANRISPQPVMRGRSGNHPKIRAAVSRAGLDGVRRPDARSRRASADAVFGVERGELPRNFVDGP